MTWISCSKKQGEERGFRWLKELHSKIWGRDGFIPTLFKRVEVTRANYDQLQDILNRKYMGRDDAKYNGNHDVLSDKLGFLWSLPAAKFFSPSHPDDKETGVRRQATRTTIWRRATSTTLSMSSQGTRTTIWTRATTTITKSTHSSHYLSRF